MSEYLPWIVSVCTLAWSVWLGRRTIKANEANARAVQSLETGKLDLSAAELGSEIFRGIIKELRDEIKECDEERKEQKAVLVRYGLMPR